MNEQKNARGGEGFGGDLERRDDRHFFDPHKIPERAAAFRDGPEQRGSEERRVGTERRNPETQEAGRNQGHGGKARLRPKYARDHLGKPRRRVPRLRHIARARTGEAEFDHHHQARGEALEEGQQPPAIRAQHARQIRQCEQRQRFAADLHA